MGSGGGVAWEYGQGNCVMWSKVLVVKLQRCVVEASQWHGAAATVRLRLQKVWSVMVVLKNALLLLEVSRLRR